MENDKINEIGKKLDVNTSVILKERLKKKKKIQYKIANALNFVLSCSLGGVFGYFESRGITGYPFMNMNSIFGFAGTSIINISNGGFTLSQRFNSILNKKKRTQIFILNFLISAIAYTTIFNLVAYAHGYPGGILYNVYSSKKKQ